MLAVKQNQPTLYRQVEEAIDAGLDEHRTVETGHGRYETQTYAVFPAPESVDPAGSWRDLNAVGMAITESIDSLGHRRSEVRYDKDKCRVKTDHAPAKLSLIRRFALRLLKREASCRRGIETKRVKCAASDEYREKSLFNT